MTKTMKTHKRKTSKPKNKVITLPNQPKKVIKIIKFNHIYNKFRHFNLNQQFQLLMVLKGFASVLSEYFKEYDSYIDDKTEFKLPNEAIIILFFQQDNKLITTIRNYSNDDYIAWRECEGEFFKFVVNK